MSLPENDGVNADTGLFLDALYGQAEGVAHLNLGVGGYFGKTRRYAHKEWNSFFFEWPAKRDELIAAITDAADHDVYVCTHLMPGDKRAKGMAVERLTIHADIDHGQLDAESVSALGGFAIASGTPGNGQVYVPLTDPVDIDQYQALCRALGDYLGGADAKVSDNDVFRPPHTQNHKERARGSDSTPVEWLIRPDGTRVDTKSLAALLGVDLADPKPGQGAYLAAPRSHLELAPDADLTELLPRVCAALELATGDRSVDTYRVLAACYDDGLSYEQAVESVMYRSDLSERIEERADGGADLERIWSKIEDARAQTAELTRHDLNLPEWFWDRPSLNHIRRKAHHHGVPPDPVLNAVLAEVSAMMPRSTRVQTGVMSPLPLHHFAGIVGVPGGIKSGALRCARSAVKIERAVVAPNAPAVPVGNILTGYLVAGDNEIPYRITDPTGQGIVAAYLDEVPVPQQEGQTGRPKHVLQQVRSNVLLTSGEGHTLVSDLNDPNKNLGATLRAMWSGESVGQTNATKEKRRRLQEDTYTFALAAVFQRDILLQLFNEDQLGKGTPQRFLLSYAVDPNLPDDRGEDPGPLSITLPQGHIKLCEELMAKVNAEHVERARNHEGVPQEEAHKPAMLIRTAALLAVIDGRTEISTEHWRLAEVMFGTSMRIVGDVRNEKRQKKAEAKATERREAAADAAAIKEASETPEDRVRALIPGYIAEVGSKARWSGEKGIRKRFNGQRRDIADKVKDQMVADGELTETVSGQTTWVELA